MKIENDENYIKLVEGMIKPAAISELLFYQRFTKIIPRPVFKKLLLDISKKNPRMGFVIEPYSLFLFFKLKDIEKAKSMLPDRYELVKAKIFADSAPDYFYGTGIFNARATTFWGTRQESYLVARDRETGLLSWIFIDVLSNTIIAMPSKGIADPNSTQAFFTTDSKGGIFLDFKEDRTDRQLALKGTIVNGKARALDQDLWLLGNTSIAHCKDMMGRDDNPFAVVFDPAEVATALDIPVKDIRITANTLFPDLMEQDLATVLCFPYAQHYIADSPGCRTYVKDRKDMIVKYNGLSKQKEMKTFTPKIIEKQLLAGISIFIVIVLLLHIFVF
ncbi:MAG: hypothetical protein HZC28_04085 [Spirochaetes bacterium]|nr:hypothetical protein [Spirochaetota bacterium]